MGNQTNKGPAEVGSGGQDVNMAEPGANKQSDNASNDAQNNDSYGYEAEDQNE